jgi:ABC-type multidrug transport system ATPase subunit
MIKVHLQWRQEHKQMVLQLKTRYVIGRDPSRCDLVVANHWQGCSRLQAELHWQAGGWVVQDGVAGKASANGTFRADGGPLYGPTELGAIQELTLLVGKVPDDRIRIHIQGLEPPELHQASPSKSIPVDTGRKLTAATAQRPSSLSGNQPRTLSIGRQTSCSICLDDPTVSRVHALLRPEGNGMALLEDRSRNGLFINGKKAGRLSRIHSGADVRIGRGRFRWDGKRLVPQGDQLRFGIEVRDLELSERIRSLSLSIVGGQLVALVGGSGAGKSSLLTTLAGQNPEYRGQIQINDEDLRRSIGALRPLMGFVPQDDIVHPELSVSEVLSFAARLRIPDREARQPAMERVLQLLEIDHRRNALVRDLSGGQRKRVNIGMELVADPRLLFLDEPTSGLDPGLDRRMMRLLRQLADQGHTVLVVTHATANVNLCDQLVFLGRGGRLCYAGSPSGCLQHYRVGTDFAEVYDRVNISDSELELEAKLFRQQQALPELTNQPLGNLSRQITSAGMQPLRKFGSQLKTVLQRELLVSWRDRVSLGLNLLTAPVAIMLLAGAIQKPKVFEVPSEGLNPGLLPLAIKVVFVMSCACIWTGISSHIGAVARERPIYERERSFNLQPLAYVAAKGLFIFLLALPQALLIATTAAVLFTLPAPAGIGSSLVGYGIAAMLTIMASGAMALFLSTLVKDQRQAGSSSPLLLMPQLILSGVLFEIGSLTALYPAVASRWAVKLFGAYSALDKLYVEPALTSLPRVDVEPYASTFANVKSSSTMLMLQFAAFVVLALVALSRRKGLDG